MIISIYTWTIQLPKTLKLFINFYEGGYKIVQSKGYNDDEYDVITGAEYTYGR